MAQWLPAARTPPTRRTSAARGGRWHVSNVNAVVRLEIDNQAYDGCDSDWITLSADRARRLAHALIAIADDVERSNRAAAA